MQRVPGSKGSGVGGAGGGEVLDSLITIAPGINPNDSDGGVWHAAELLHAGMYVFSFTNPFHFQFRSHSHSSHHPSVIPLMLMLILILTIDRSIDPSHRIPNTTRNALLHLE